MSAGDRASKALTLTCGVAGRLALAVVTRRLGRGLVEDAILDLEEALCILRSIL